MFLLIFQKILTAVKTAISHLSHLKGHKICFIFLEEKSVIVFSLAFMRRKGVSTDGKTHCLYPTQVLVIDDVKKTLKSLNCGFPCRQEAGCYKVQLVVLSCIRLTNTFHLTLMMTSAQNIKTS